METKNGGNCNCDLSKINMDMTVKECGFLTVSLLSETPPSAIVAVGETGVENIDFTALDLYVGDEDIAICSLPIISTGHQQAFGNIALLDGTQVMARNLHLNNENGTTWIFPPTDPWIMRANTHKTLAILANVNGVSNGAVSGDILRLGIKVADVKAVGVISCKIIPPEQGANTLYGSEMVLKKSKPYIAAATLPNTVLTAGEKTIYRWTVTADPQGDISWKVTAFQNTGSIKASNGTVYNVATGDMIQGGMRIIENSSIMSFAASAKQPVVAGQTNTYELRGKIITEPKAGDIVTTRIPAGTAIPDNGIIDTASFIWSDGLSWATDYLVPGIPTASLSLTKGSAPEPTPSITVLSPNGGEVWVIGQTYNITWTSLGLSDEKIKIVLDDATGPVEIITQCNDTGGSYLWHIDGEIGGVMGTVPLPPGSYKIAIGKGNTTDISDNYFSIKAPETVQVSVKAPETVSPGDNFTAYILISDVTNFDACDYEVSFDSSVLNLTSVAPGAIGNTIIPVDIFNKYQPGKCSVVQNLPGLTGVSGSGTLATLRFNALRDGNTTIALTNGTVCNTEAVTLNTAWQGAAIKVDIVASLKAQINALMQRLQLLEQRPVGDVNGDGNINAGDITKLERIIVKLDK